MLRPTSRTTPAGSVKPPEQRLSLRCASAAAGRLAKRRTLIVMDCQRRVQVQL